MEPHSALIIFNKCKGSSRERNKGCSKEITRSAPRDGMYLSHLYLAWPRRKRAHGKKGQYRHTKKESFQKLRLPKGSGSGTESGLPLPSSHTWPLRPELKRTQARHEGFPGRSSGWPVPLVPFSVTHSPYAFLEFPGAGWPATPLDQVLDSLRLPSPSLPN